MNKLSVRALPLTISFCLAVTAASAQQAPINLGSDSTFAILAGTTVTVTGGGTITGNIGIYPGTAYVPGVPAVTVNGSVYQGGPVAAQAQADLATAYNDAAGRSVAPVTLAGNIGGLTLAPGLYKSTSSLAISSGDLTLDAQGNANAVWIFQIASTLTTTSGRQVILAGGANAGNIFWQVGSSATIGTTSVFKGNILAAVSISMLTGSTLTGRALAQGGAVTVDTGGGSSASLPAPQAGPAAPTVISTIPANGTNGVPTGSKLSATFSTAMNPATISASTFTLAQGSTPVAGVVTYTGTTATFTPTGSLSPSTAFTATITTGAKDQNGVALASNYVWTFTTGLAIDTTPPTVISTVPSSGATAVSNSNKLSATFSKAMDPATISASSFALTQGGTPVAGAVTYSANTASFTPASLLAPGTVYTATITTGAKDLAGNSLATNYAWIFTTGTAVSAAPVVVFTLTATNFVSPVAAGGIAAVFGNNLSTGQASSTPPFLTTSLAQSGVSIGGRAAPLFFASPNQVNLQIPWETAGQTQTSVTVTVNGTASNTQIVAIAPFAPGIFSMDASGTGQGAIVISSTGQLAASGTPATRGTYVSIYCSGLGPVSNQPGTGIAASAAPLSFTLNAPTVTIGGATAVTNYSGLAPGLVGLYQVNALVPAGIATGNAVPVVLSIGNTISNTVTIGVQ